MRLPHKGWRIIALFFSLDRFEAGSRGPRPVAVQESWSSSHFQRNGRTDRQIEKEAGLWCPSAALVMPCDGRSRHRRARRRTRRRGAHHHCARFHYALSCLAVAVPAVVVPRRSRRANGIAVGMPVIAVLAWAVVFQLLVVPATIHRCRVAREFEQNSVNPALA
jgi:hypothetical protein